MVFLEELQARNFSKVSLNFNEIPNSLWQILQTYPEICIFCVCSKNNPLEAVGKDWSESAREILWWNLMTMWWNYYYNKFVVEVWRWLGILGISFFIFFNFFQIFRLCSSVNKNLSYRMVITFLSLLCNLSYRMRSLCSFF